MADDSWVASTLMADTRTNSCGVADIRNVYPFPEVKGGTLNDAYPITSFSYKCKSSITLTSNINTTFRVKSYLIKRNEIFLKNINRYIRAMN